MIKKILLAIAIAFPLSLAAQTPKFGVVSADQILQAMPEFTEVQTKIGESSKQYEDEYTKLQQEFEKKYAELQELQKDAATPDGIKERRLQEIQELDAKAQQFLQTAQQELQRQQMTLLQPVQEKLMLAIKTVGNNNGFTMIFPAEAPAFVSTDVVDVTPLVKTELGIK